MKTNLDIKSAPYIDAMICYADTLLGIRFSKVKKNRYNAPCPFHADSKAGFMAYVNKKDEIRFHCFGACKGDWDIYDLIMLRMKYRFRKAQQVWDELGRNAIERMAAKSNGWVYYLGGLDEDQAPYDMLKPVVDAIGGFSLKHLKADACCAGNH